MQTEMTHIDLGDFQFWTSPPDYMDIAIDLLVNGYDTTAKRNSWQRTTVAKIFSPWEAPTACCGTLSPIHCCKGRGDHQICVSFIYGVFTLSWQGTITHHTACTYKVSFTAARRYYAVKCANYGKGWLTFASHSTSFPVCVCTYMRTVTASTGTIADA